MIGDRANGLKITGDPTIEFKISWVRTNGDRIMGVKTCGDKKLIYRVNLSSVTGL